MEAGLRRHVGVLAALCLALVACDQDPARTVKIIARPIPKSEPVAPPRAVTSPPAREPARAAKVTRRPGPTSRSEEAPSSGATAPVEARSAPVYEFQWRPELCPPPPEPSRGPSTLVATGACAFRQRGAMQCSSSQDDFYLEMKRPAAREATLLIYVNVERYKGPGAYDKAEMLVGVQDPAYNFRWFSDTVRITVAEDEKFVDIEPVRLEPLPPVEAPDIEVAGTLWCRPAGGPSGAASQ
jgi:hypothetical protein